MPPDADIPKDRPILLIEGILGDKGTLKTLLSRSDDREAILDRASLDIAGLNPAETTIFTRELLMGLGTENRTWDQDRRDGALEILPLVEFEKVRKEDLSGIYKTAVSMQTKDSDPIGTIASLAEAGKVVASFLPPGEQTRREIDAVWTGVARNFEGEDRTGIISAKNEITRLIPLNPEDLLGDPDVRLGWREKPKFQPDEEAMHDVYIGGTQNNRSFKIALWEATPRFRALTTAHGLDLERFWNLSNPDEVQASFADMTRIGSPIAQAQLAKSLRTEFGLGMEELTGDRPRVVADEIVHAARVGYAEITGSIVDFDVRLERFRELVEEAQDKPAQAQRAVIRQISNFFTLNGVDLGVRTLAALGVQLDNPAVIKPAETAFNQKYADRREAAQVLSETFDLDEAQTEFALMSRQRKDMMLGDITGDCTSYHLNVGMNAWTLPSWMMNPGFNFYKIAPEGQLIGKFGLVLAIADRQLVVDADSFEVGHGIKDEAAAVTKIKEGLSFLGRWSQRIGLKDPFINTISNSSGAVDLLQGTVRASRVESMQLFGGLSGLAEVRKNLVGQGTAIERIYLQSEGREFGLLDDERDDDRTKYLQHFEGLISTTINKALPNERAKIEEAARGKNWSELFKHILDANYPEVSKEFGSNWAYYQGLLDNLEIDEYGSVKDDAYVGVGRAKKDTLADLVTDRSDTVKSEAWARYAERGVRADDVDEAYNDSNETQLMEQAIEVDELLALIKEMEFRKITPEVALDQLYGQATSQDTEEPIVLNNRLPRLAI